MKESKRDRFNKAVILAYAEMGGSRDGLNNQVGNELCDKCYKLGADPTIAAEILLLADKAEYQKKVVFEYARLGGSIEGLDDKTVIRGLEGGYQMNIEPEITADAMITLDKESSKSLE